MAQETSEEPGQAHARSQETARLARQIERTTCRKFTLEDKNHPLGRLVALESAASRAAAPALG